MILYHGYAVTALNRDYWAEAEFADEFGEITPYRGPAGGAPIAAPAGGQMMLMVLPEASKRPIIAVKRKTGHAGIPGTGPAGESCGSCGNYRSIRGGSRTFPKCVLMRAKWSAGPGSDIRKSDPACGRWTVTTGEMT